MKPRIVKTPGTCGGKPRLDGRRLCVHDVISGWQNCDFDAQKYLWTERADLTVEEFLLCLQYYMKNQAEINWILVQRRRIYEYNDAEFTKDCQHELMNTKIEITERRYNELRQAECWAGVWERRAWETTSELLLLKSQLRECYAALRGQIIVAVDEEHIRELLTRLEQNAWIYDNGTDNC